MKNIRLNSELKEMMAEKGGTCVSVIIPTHRKSPDRQQDELQVKKLVLRVQKKIIEKYPDHMSGEILDKMEELVNGIDLLHASEGIGIYVSQNFSKLVYFPFPVKEKVTVSDNFEIRDLFYLEKFQKEYLVLSVTEKGARLFKGKSELLTEVNDEFFPEKFVDDYEYAHSNRANSTGYSLKGFEKDRSIIEEIRLTAFYKTVAYHLEKYLEKETVLVLAGPVKDMSMFAGAFDHTEKIAGKIHGNFNHNLHELAQLAWQRITEFRKKEQENMVEQLRESGNKLVTGIKEAWGVAEQGQAMKMIVERDLSKPCFFEKREGRILLRSRRRKHRNLTDAVDRLMESVLSKNGSVEFVENGSMKEFGGFALVKRY